MAKTKETKAVEPVIETVAEVVVSETKQYDPAYCANCGIKLNEVMSRHNELNFCSIQCYNSVVK